MSSAFHQASSTIPDGNMSFLYGNKNEVIQNRLQFLQASGFDLDQAVALKTSDSTKIVEITAQDFGRGMRDLESAVQADAMISSDKRVVLFVLTADCLPITFFDPEHQVIGLAHLSRKNTELGFSQKIVEHFMNKVDSQPQQLQVSIGPAIHQESYLVDLIGQNIDQLKASGVVQKKIEVSPIDTFLSDDYFSHRRSVVTGQAEGRFATIVSLSNVNSN